MKSRIPSSLLRYFRCFLPLFAASAIFLGNSPRANAQVARDCGQGVTLRLSSLSPAQGGLVELTVTSAATLEDLKGTWAGNALPLWQVGEHTHHALLGVDLERAPGKYELSLDVKNSDGAPLACQVDVTVRDGHFKIESLHVANQFVDVSPEDRERGDKESARLHEILSQTTPERLWHGAFRMPLAGVKTGHNFGTRRVLNGEPRSPHSGLDMGAPAGTKVFAPQAGRVVLADDLFFSGNTVVIDHGLGIYTFYGHLNSIAVHEGDDVTAGVILGRVGSTGRVTGPHLHWALIVNGAHVNPLQIVALGVH
jgi:hypothetical protein